MAYSSAGRADSPQWTEPLVRQILTAMLRLPAIAEAYRSGGGVPWESFGPDMSRSQGDVNRPALRHALANVWVPQIPDLRDRLAAPVRVADVGCGHGWSAVGIALAFPSVQVDGFDLDAGALRKAASDDAVVIVVDEAADPVLTTPGDEVQRLLYGFSLLICLPDTLAHPQSAATGAVMRPQTLTTCAKAAGFASVEPLDVDGTGFWRLYRLRVPT